MTNDEELRARFRALADEDAAAAREFSPDAVDRARMAAGARRAPRSWTAARRLAAIGASAAVVIVVLAIGLVWGANTGYASARVESDRQRNEVAGTMLAVTSELGALRLDLERARSDMARRAAEKGAVAPASFLAAEKELQAMEASAERIELVLAQSREGPAASRPALFGSMPMKRALAVTCSAFAPGRVTPSVTTVTPPDPTAIAQPGIPILTLPPASATSATTVGGRVTVMQLSSGKVLVNDQDHRQMKLLDSALAGAIVVRDSAPGSASSYGPIPGGLIRYRGDSSLFPDRPSRSLIVLDAGGQATRAWAMPNDPDAINSLILRASAVDQKGRLIYTKAPDARNMPMATDSATVAAMSRDPHDSVEIVRADLDSRRLDTLGRIGVPARGQVALVPGADGRTRVMRVIRPLLTLDDWAVLSDGTIAFVRGHDYHVDWIHPDGSKSSTGKLPFDWRRLTDADKQRLIDSTRSAQDSAAARAARFLASNPDVSVRGGRGGAEPGGVRTVPPPITIAGPVEIPDYYPPLRPGAAIADLDGNLWILPTTTAQSLNGELVYDVVNPRVGLFERVRIPEGRSVVGFGKGGVVYLMSGDRANGFRVERTRVPASSKPARP